MEKIAAGKQLTHFQVAIQQMARTSDTFPDSRFSRWQEQLTHFKVAVQQMARTADSFPGSRFS